MNTHTIPEKVKSKIDRMYEGADKERVIAALESGKTVYKGKVKLRGVKVDKSDGSDKTIPAPPAPGTDTSDTKKPGKDANK